MRPLRFVVTLVLLFCLTPAVSAQDQEGKVIQALLHEYYTVMSDRDWQSYRSFFIDSAILVTIWTSPGSGEAGIYRATIEEFIKKTPEGPDSQPVFEERMTQSQIEVKGGMAVAWVDYEAKFGTPQNLMEWTGKDLFTLIKWKDTWKIVSLTYLSDH